VGHRFEFIAVLYSFFMNFVG